MSTVKYESISKLDKEEQLRLGEIVQKNLPFYEKSIDPNLSSVEKAEMRKKYYHEIKAYNDATETLIKANVGLVTSQVKAFASKIPSSTSYDEDDMIQCGMNGLFTAIRKYDPSRGNNLSTVATWWIYQEITRTYNKEAKLIRLPENRVADNSYLQSLHRDFPELSTAEIERMAFEERNLTREDITVISNASSSTISLNGFSADGDEEKDITDLISYKYADDNAMEAAERADVNSKIRDCFLSLTEKEQDCIRALFGLGDGKKKGVVTLKKVRAKSKYKFNTPEEVEEFGKKSLVKLKVALEKNGITKSDVL